MYQLDKERFGRFVAELRREKGLTQKQLAQSLCISDKAVSKWETGASIPDTALLIPLAEQLGVTVTELLLCRRQERPDPMDAGQVEAVVQAAIRYADGPKRAYQVKDRWRALYALSLLAGGAGIWANARFGWLSVQMLTLTLLGAIFGAYFCLFALVRLPAYYDENRISAVSDGIFRLNMVGVAFHNGNWPYVLRAGRAWSCAMLALTPPVFLGMNAALSGTARAAADYVVLAAALGGLFVPMYVAAKRHEDRPVGR